MLATYADVSTDVGIRYRGLPQGLTAYEQTAAGTYCKHDADWFREQIQGFGDEILTTDDHTQVRDMVAAFIFLNFLLAIAATIFAMKVRCLLLLARLGLLVVWSPA